MNLQEKAILKLSENQHKRIMKEAFELWNDDYKEKRKCDHMNNIAMLNDARQSNVFDGLYTLINQAGQKIFEFDD